MGFEEARVEIRDCTKFREENFQEVENSIRVLSER